MKISLTTLGCPSWDLPTICRQGAAFGFDGVDFRGLQEELDITKRPEFTSSIGTTKRLLEEAGLAVSGISSSITVCAAERLAANLEEARRTIPVALALGAQNIRVFGGGDLTKHGHVELAKRGAEAVQQLLALDGANQLRWLFETHDNWIRAEDCRLLLERIDDPAFGALWDIGHTARVGGEIPAASFSAIGSRVGYVHIKDAHYDPGHPQAMSDGWRYVLPGEGQLPLNDGLQLLKAAGYEGWLVYESEKRWHPALPEPEIAFPAFVNWVKPLLAAD